MSSAAYLYPGDELDLFAHARNWKRYWTSTIGLFVRGDVLEVGAGIASNTRLMLGPDVRSWLCLEPDRRLVERLNDVIAADPALARCRVAEGTVAGLDASLFFDAIVYIDVLEHIEDDRGELRQAAARLKPGGSLIVLSPAHQWLYTDFDRAIGHCRRYSRRALADISPPSTNLHRLFYLDSVGLLVSGSNRFLLKSAMPTLGQIKFWDRFIVPCSSVVDCLTRHSVGKSVVAIWERAT